MGTSGKRPLLEVLSWIAGIASAALAVFLWLKPAESSKRPEHEAPPPATARAASPEAPASVVTPPPPRPNASGPTVEKPQPPTGGDPTPSEPKKATIKTHIVQKGEPAPFEDGSSASVDTFWAGGGARLKITTTDGKVLTSTSRELVYVDGGKSCYVEYGGQVEESPKPPKPKFRINHICIPK